MKRCTVAGIDAVQKCNLHCSHCYYNFRQWSGGELSLGEAMALASDAKQRGCDSIVVEGCGEPTLWTHLVPFILACKAIDMEVQIITNGTAPVKKYDLLYSAGLNHMLVSVHHIGRNYDRIVRIEGAGEKQKETLEWLKKNNAAWRSNTTIQQWNAQQLPEITDYILSYGAFHIVLLGFLPHYEWEIHVSEVAEHPAIIRPYAERAIDKCIAADVWCHLKYHPFCHLDKRYWKYITNATYCLLDNGEWDYNSAGLADDALIETCKRFGAQFGIQGEPCCQCSLKPHCGGWNKTYARAFAGAKLTAIQGEPQDFGYFWYQNPVNNLFTGRNRK